MDRTFAVAIGGAAGQGVLRRETSSPSSLLGEDCTLMLTTRISRSFVVSTLFSQYAPVSSR